MTVLENIKIGFHINTKTNLFDALLHTRRYQQDEYFVEERGAEILENVGLGQYASTKAGNLPYGIQRKVEIT